jgi:hypothetical protein
MWGNDSSSRDISQIQGYGSIEFCTASLMVGDSWVHLSDQSGLDPDLWPDGPLEQVGVPALCDPHDLYIMNQTWQARCQSIEFCQVNSTVCDSWVHLSD